MSSSEKVVPAVIEFVDIAGLVKGASEGEGLGNKFLANIRETDAIAHVVRCFDDPDIQHVHGKVDPKGDIEVIELELAYADLATVEKRLENVEKKMKAGRDRESENQLGLLARLKEALAAGRPARTVEPTDDERPFMRELQLLTAKPVIYVLNVDEDQLARGYSLPFLKPEEQLAVSVKIESEIAQLSEGEAKEFMASYGMKESGLDRLIRASYRLLGLQTFLTTGPKETRAWTVRAGATAPEAAGVIHTDFEKNFIRAEIIPYDEFVAHGGEAGARDAGKLRIEGKEYVMREGDVAHFRVAT